MTFKSEDFNYDPLAQTQHQLAELIPDSFELLSAYIDGELSASEKKQVQAWLDRDPQFKQLYTQLLALQGQMQHSVAPPSDKSVDEITAEVFQSLDRSRHWRRKLVWGGSAIAASVIATVSGIVPGFTPWSLRTAKIDPPSEVSTPVMLAVAVDRPAINIPKSVVGYPNRNSQIDLD